MNKQFLSLLAATALLACSCQNNPQQHEPNAAPQDTVAAESQPQPCVADTVLTSAAQYYSESVDATKAYQRMAKVDSLLAQDMSDLKKETTYLFYPFGGPDFIFPHHIAPNAEVYFLMGLEPLGQAPSDKDDKKLPNYAQALAYYFKNSYYVTQYMQADLSMTKVGGTLPIITMLMAKEDCQIISVKKMNFDEQGNMVDATDKDAHLAEIKFFSSKTPTHEQTVYYYRGNTEDKAIEPGLTTYLSKTLPKYKVSTFLKAASYLMHGGSFKTIRSTALDHSWAILGDDSGIPYRFFDQKVWDITLYGSYQRPLKWFSDYTFQRDLDAVYKEKKSEIKPLDFRIGYNFQSNWMCARKK